VFALQTVDHWCRVDTEFCETNLESYINGSGSGFGLMPWADARSQGKDTFFIVAILQQLLSGLVFIHSHDLIHGFLSPDKGNLFSIKSLIKKLYTPLKVDGGKLLNLGILRNSI
jgi:serine/threonine protein kinase